MKLHLSRHDESLKVLLVPCLRLSQDFNTYKAFCYSWCVLQMFIFLKALEYQKRPMKASVH